MANTTTNMTRNDWRTTSLRLAAVLALACSASAHSWVEQVARIAPNGTLVGVGYPRGYKDRASKGWSDEIPMLRLPATGTAFYTGNEIINKFNFTDKPEFPMLQASAGDSVAFSHHENGHVTLIQNQPHKPRNRGTIYFYGTSQPKAQEKLFDIHLRWNKDGTGGDKRGVLLATRNFDDGQCYQPNHQQIAEARAAKFKTDGASSDKELICQADVKLPSDLKPGSIYTVYWYWDWPDLNEQKIDMEKTKDGLYPWAGSFMRGDAVPNGWNMDTISRNESYASAVDIIITEGKAQLLAATESGAKEAWVAQQDIYSKAVREQMSSNFQVQVGDSGKGDAAVPASGSGPAPVAPSLVATPATSASGNGVLTVTRTNTVPPTTLLTTAYRTVQPGESRPTAAVEVKTVTEEVTVTVTAHVPPPTAAAVSSTANTAMPVVTPFRLRRGRRSFALIRD